MAAASQALATAALLLAATLCAADSSDYAFEPAVGPSSAQPDDSQRPQQPPRSSNEAGGPFAAEAPSSEDLIASYDEPTLAEAPLEVPMEPPRPREVALDAPLEVASGPAGAGPEGPVGRPATPVPGPDDLIAAEGDLRLVRSRAVGDTGYVVGALQAFVGGAFGAVCNNRFDDVDASVACRQLGFVGGVATEVENLMGSFNFDLERDEDIVAPFVLENLNCTGTEERLVDCPGATDVGFEDYLDEYFGYRYTSVGAQFGGCDAIERSGYTAVLCGSLTGPEDQELRLARGGGSGDGSVQYGAMEVFDRQAGGWNRVCDGTVARLQDRLGRGPLPDAAVTVACRQLGFEGGERAIVDIGASDFDARPSFPLVLRNTNCTGAEASLSGCPGGPQAPSDLIECEFVPDLAVECSSIGTDTVSAGTDGTLRLTEGQAGPGFEYGRLEIFLRGLWRTICDREGFTPDSAAVACAALGFDGGSVLNFGYRVLPSSFPVGLAFVNCDGSEASLLECASLSTYDEITDARGGGGNACTASDSTVLACGTASADCPAPPPPAEGSVRLVGGFGTPCDPLHSGFVEVFHDDEWGSVCNGRNRRVAGAICRQLGFPHGTVTDARAVDPDGDYQVDFTSEESAAPPERFWLSEVFCAGPEDRLVDCNLGPGFRDANAGCTRDPRALSVACRTFAVDAALEAVTTPGAEEGDVRLVEQSTVDNWQLGRLELFFEGSWGPVCSTGFNGQDATVACRRLGLGAGAVTPRTPEGDKAQTGVTNLGRREFLRPTEPLVAPAVSLAGGPNCVGTEAGLLECPGAKNGANADGGGCALGLLIACVAEEQAGDEGALRLTTIGAGDIDNDPEAGVGILEVFHAGAWGTLCNGDPAAVTVFEDYDYGTPDDGLTEEAALVACRQLGFETGEFRGVQRLPEDVMRRPAWLADLPCATGTEASVLDCGDLAFGDTSACGLAQRLLCSDGEADLPFLTPRLVESETAPDGQWSYGRLEVFDGLAFVPLADIAGGDELGRRGAQVACRQLGFAAGGQALAGSESALPLPTGTGRDNRLGGLLCNGDEASLAECDTRRPFRRSDYDNYGRSVEDNAVALVCYNPSGCAPNGTSGSAEPAPQQGDIRLVSLTGTDNPTQPCDDVHLGGVEFFNEGQWGRLCVTGFRTRSTWTVDATVACRQLGFPFGSLMDNSEDLAFGADFDYESPGLQRPTWASIVFCKGTEERLDECSFIEDFGRAGTDIRSRPNLAEVACSDTDIVSVICRRFPMEESDVIRRL